MIRVFKVTNTANSFSAMAGRRIIQQRGEIRAEEDGREILFSAEKRSQ